LNQGPLIPGKISVSFPNLTPPSHNKERKKLKTLIAKFKIANKKERI